MKQKLLSFVFVFAFLLEIAFAQNRQVTGKVTSAVDGRPLVGVSVLAVGGADATQTDALGNYSLTIPDDVSTVSFSYVGFLTQRVVVPRGNLLHIRLEPEDHFLKEVVVVGYGTATRESFTGTAKRVDAENIERKAVSNITQALAGEVAGVNVVNVSGQPGTVATVRIRGFGSVNGNRSPLYVLDGVPFNGGLTGINPVDIESTTVLKDAAATAIYGSRGANGVILINTKKGKGRRSFVEADANFGVNMAWLPRYDVIRSPEEYIALGWEGLYNSAPATVTDRIDYANSNLFDSRGVNAANNIWNVNSAADLIDPETRKVRPGVTRRFDPERWEDYAFQDAARSDLNVRFGGSQERANYYTSIGYLNDKGYSINSDFERFSARVNVDNRVKSWLDVGTNIGYSRIEINNGGQSSDSGSIFWFVDNIPPIYPLFERDGDGNKVPDVVYGGFLYDYGESINRRFGALTNSISDAKNSVRKNRRNEINAVGYANFNIVPGLSFENSFGLNYFHNNFISRDSKFYGPSASIKGSIGQTRTERASYNLLNLIRYKKVLGLHSLEALAAHEAQDFQDNVMFAGKNQLVRDDSDELDNAVVMSRISSYTNRYTLESFLGQINYDYGGKYYLSGSLRKDGSSRFVNKKWGTFGSLGASWIVSKEAFMSSQKFFTFLKYKMSYGVIGDQSVGAYYPGLITYPVSNLNGLPSIGSANVGNPDLTWERAKMAQAGLEFSIGKYISASVDYYSKHTDNLVFDRRLGPSIGYALIKVNDGKLRNRGIEFDVTGHLLKASNYYLDLNVNGESFSNKIVTMPIDPSTKSPKAIDVVGSYGYANGRSLYDFYMRDFVGVDPEDGRSMWKVYYTDKNSNSQFDEGEQIVSLAAFESPDGLEISEGTTKVYNQATLHFINKSAIPKLRGAVNLRGGYKSFDLAVQLIYSFGGYSYDGTYASLMHSSFAGSNNWHKDVFGRWQQPGDLVDVPRLSNAADPNVNSVSTRFLTKADYLILNNVRLTYNFSKSLLNGTGVEGLGIWASGDNLWQHTKREGFYPSTSESGSSSAYRYAPLSTFTFGLRAKF